MKIHTFQSQMRVGDRFWTDDDDDQSRAREVKNEPSFFRSTTAYARRHGGPITRAFLDAAKYDGGIFDSRVHMLMPGWYPCIPGWHHDDVPRTRADKQPDYDAPAYKAHHCMGLVNGDICPTEFLVGMVRLEEVPIGKTIYSEWHRMIEAYIATAKRTNGGQALSWQVRQCPTDHCVYFTADDFHRGVRAVKSGFRWFGRVTINTQIKAENEIRHQTNVYLEPANEGW